MNIVQKERSCENTKEEAKVPMEGAWKASWRGDLFCAQSYRGPGLAFPLPSLHLPRGRLELRYEHTMINFRCGSADCTLGGMALSPYLIHCL